MARIQKARSPTDPSATAAGFASLSQQADAELDNARREAAEILATTREEAQRLRQDAERRAESAARQTVEQELRDEFQRRCASVLPALQRAAAAVQAEAAGHLRHNERYVVRLAVAIAERLVRRELKQTPQIPLALIREALDLAASSPRMELHLHPVDCETLRDRYADMTTPLREASQLEIVPDPAIERGGCVVRTEFGQIDQQWTTQLARIEEELN